MTNTDRPDRIRMDDLPDQSEFLHEQTTAMPSNGIPVPDSSTWTGPQGQRMPSPDVVSGGSPGPPEIPVLTGEDLLEMEFVPELPETPAPFEQRKPGAIAEALNFVTHSMDNWQSARQAHRARVSSWEDEVRARRSALQMQNEQLLDLCDSTSIMLIPVASKGGAAKTTTSTCLASRIAQAVMRPVYLYDANPDFGGVAARCNVDPDRVLTLSQFYEIHKTANFNELSGLIRPSRHGVTVLAADPDEVARNITPEQTQEMLETLKRHVRVLVVDLGTGVSTQVNEVAHRLADAYVFPMLVTSGTETKNGPVDGRISTQRRLVTQSHDDPNDPHELIALKADYGLTVAIGARPDTNLDAFRNKIGVTNNLLAVPWDDPSERTQPVWLPDYNGPLTGVPGMMSVGSAIAWGNVAIKCYDLAAEIKETADKRQAQSNTQSSTSDTETR